MHFFKFQKLEIMESGVVLQWIESDLNSSNMLGDICSLKLSCLYCLLITFVKFLKILLCLQMTPIHFAPIFYLFLVQDKVKAQT